MTFEVDQFLTNLEHDAKKLKDKFYSDEDNDKIQSQDCSSNEFSYCESTANNQIYDTDGHEILFKNWRILKDPRGKPYYWNKTTDETVWERPEPIVELKKLVGTEEVGIQTNLSRSEDANSEEVIEILDDSDS